jgi:proline racemase
MARQFGLRGILPAMVTPFTAHDAQVDTTALAICPAGTVDVNDPGTWAGRHDRSPCGTGTCGRMAAKHARGELALGEPFVHESILGTRFTGRLEELVPGHPKGAVRPVIAGSAWVTGMGRLLLVPRRSVSRGIHRRRPLAPDATQHRPSP